MDQPSKRLGKGIFKLRKGCSNVSAVLDGVADKDKESYYKFDDGTDFAKTLGLAWDPLSDHILIFFPALQSASSPCRRSVLSAIARVYDPLGLVGLVITKSNNVLQQLCKEMLSWDERGPELQNTEWSAFCTSFGQIRHASLPRLVISPNTESEIHGLCQHRSIWCLCLHRLQRPISITLLKVKGSPHENTHWAQAGTVWGGTPV